MKCARRRSHPRASFTLSSVCSPKNSSATARNAPCALGKVAFRHSFHHSPTVPAPKSSSSGKPYICGCWPSIVETTELKERGGARTKTGCSAENVRAGSVGVAATGETAGSFCLRTFLTGIFKRWLLRPILGALRSIVHSFPAGSRAPARRQSALRKSGAAASRF